MAMNRQKWLQMIQNAKSTTTGIEAIKIDDDDNAKDDDDDRHLLLLFVDGKYRTLQWQVIPDFGHAVGMTIKQSRQPLFVDVLSNSTHFTTDVVTTHDVTEWSTT